MFDLLFKLLIGHAIADFTGLQGDFIAKGKNHRKPLDDIPFFLPLAAHALIHAGIVWYITNSKICMLAEFISHFVIDFLKCDDKISFEQDQFLHFLMKFLYWIYVNV